MTIEEIYAEAIKRPLEVYEVFKDFYGEDRVDIQGLPSLEFVKSNSTLSAVRTVSALQSYIHFFDIFVHFPNVRITNEHDKYVDITELYAKVNFTATGVMREKFMLNRAEYTKLHWDNNYMHSHVSSIPKHDIQEFQQPCTGTGPINTTISALMQSFDADLLALFCLELDKYVHTESLAGVPYHKLENLVRGGRRSISYPIYQNFAIQNMYEFDNALSKSEMAEFMCCVVNSNILKFCYTNGSWNIAMSEKEFAVKLSNLFIVWYNKKVNAGKSRYSRQETITSLLGNNILIKCVYSNGYFRTTSNPLQTGNIRLYEGQLVCKFKGNDVRLHILPEPETEDTTNYSYLLHPKVTGYIYTKIINFVNYEYGKHRDNSENRTCQKIKIF